MSNLAEPPTNEFAKPTEQDQELRRVLKAISVTYPNTIYKAFYAVDFAARLVAVTITSIEKLHVEAGSKVDDEVRLAILDSAMDSYAERLYNALRWLRMPSAWDEDNQKDKAALMASAKRISDAIARRRKLEKTAEGSA